MIGLALAAMLAGSVDLAECFPREDIVIVLDAKKMRPLFTGLNQYGVVTEVWVSQPGEWIELATNADGLTCIFDGGSASVVFTAGEPA